MVPKMDSKSNMDNPALVVFEKKPYHINPAIKQMCNTIAQTETKVDKAVKLW